MEIVFHLGVHATDDDRIAKTLLRNKGALAGEGIVVPWPRQYRHVLRDLLARLNGAHASDELQDVILDSLMIEDEPRRVIFANAYFLGAPQNAVGQGRLYPGLAQAAVALRNLFPDKAVSFTFAIRNPATLIPALFTLSQPSTAADFLSGTDPAGLRWSDTIAQMREAVPDCPVTLWCDEDWPVLWPVILRAVSGHSEGRTLERADEYLAPLMTPEGFAAMQAFLAERPPASEEHRRRTVATFLERHALPEAMEVEIEMPGWTAELIEEMSAAYDADMGRIARIEGVDVLR